MADEAADGSSAWGRTLREVDGMAADLRDDGWTVVTVRAGHVAPLAPGQGETDRFGLVYLAPDGVADELSAIAADAEFDRYEVFRRRDDSDLFVLTRVTDPDARAAVLLAGSINLAATDALIDAVRERGVLDSHVRLLDGTHILSVRHDDPSAFFPRLERDPSRDGVDEADGV